MKNKSYKRIISDAQNSYLLDEHNNHIIYLHPVIDFLLNIEKKENLDNWITSFSETETCLIPAYGEISIKELFYYKEKLSYYKKHFFNKQKMYETEFQVNLVAEHIKEQFKHITNILFETTEKCNLKCTYCIYGSLYKTSKKEDRLEQEQSYENSLALLNRIVKGYNSEENTFHNQKVVIGFYGGEPLMNFPFIQKIVDYTKELNNEKFYFTYNMTTNGLLLDRYMDELVKNNFQITISLDGDEKDNQYRLTPNGENSYQIITNNIEKLRSKYPDYFEKSVTFNSVIHSKTKLSELMAYFKEKYNKTTLFNEISSNGLEPCQLNHFQQIHQKITDIIKTDKNIPTYYEDYYFNLPEGRLIKEFTEKFAMNGIIRDYHDPLLKKTHYKIMPAGTCFPFSKKIYLTARGSILPCERVDHCFQLGYIKNKKIYLDFQDIADKYNSFYKNLVTSCKTCKLGRLCNICSLTIAKDFNNINCTYHSNKKTLNILQSRAISELEKNPSLLDQIIHS